MKNGLTGPKDWKFDENVAPVFVEHARQHIPDYEAVTDKCTRYCTLNLDKQSKIIDVGCATGHTLKKLHAQGFTNLHGVDNSRHMIDLAPKHIANYVVSDQLPHGQYDMILCNWTLHFVKDKESYLTSIVDSLKDGGTLILSEKTRVDAKMTRLYHDQKMQLGVSKEQIEQKQKQLKNVMFVESAEWYRNVLEWKGFTVTIIDADWCFTTFLCKKEKQNRKDPPTKKRIKANLITLNDRLKQALDVSPVYNSTLTAVVDEFKRTNTDWKKFADLHLCEAVQISMKDIWIDTTIERSPSMEHITNILRHFSEAIVMPILVYKDHGRYVAWDGQHTAMALYIIATKVFGERPADAFVPVVVYPTKKRPDTRPKQKKARHRTHSRHLPWYINPGLTKI
jgi:tRNA (cmo5U34)-methyltransferase